jgi:hypothetical protein
VVVVVVVIVIVVVVVVVVVVMIMVVIVIVVMVVIMVMIVAVLFPPIAVMAPVFPVVVPVEAAADAIVPIATVMATIFAVARAPTIVVPVVARKARGTDGRHQTQAQQRSGDLSQRRCLHARFLAELELRTVCNTWLCCGRLSLRARATYAAQVSQINPRGGR